MERDYKARLVVYKINEMHRLEVKAMATWLRKLANDLVKDTKRPMSKYSDKFTARLMK